MMACLLVPAGMPWPAAAQASHPVVDDLEDVGKNLERERRLLRRLKHRSSSLLETLSDIDSQIGTAEKQLQGAEDRLVGLEQSLAGYRDQRRAARDRLGTCRRRLRVRLRTLYKMGEVGWLDLIFSADSVAEGLRRVHAVRRMARADAALIAETRRLQDDIRIAERRIIEQKARLRAQRDRVLARREEAERIKQEKAEALALLEREEALHRKAIGELKRARKRLGRVVSAIEGQATSARGFASWRGRLPPPVAGARIEVPFGLRVDPRFKTKTRHQGVDIRAPAGTEVRAVYPGKVVFARPFQGYGLLVILDHGGGYYTLYAHLDAFRVRKGDKLVQGQPVGTLGDTGSLKGPYLYFEVREAGRAVDPRKWVAF